MATVIYLTTMFGLNNKSGKAAGLRRMNISLDVSADDSMTLYTA